MFKLRALVATVAICVLVVAILRIALRYSESSLREDSVLNQSGAAQNFSGPTMDIERGPLPQRRSSEETTGATADPLTAHEREVYAETAEWMSRLNTDDDKAKDPLLKEIRSSVITRNDRFINYDGPYVVVGEKSDPRSLYILFRLNYYKDSAGAPTAKTIRVVPGGQFSDFGKTRARDESTVEEWKESCAAYVSFDLAVRKAEGIPQPAPEKDWDEGILILALNPATEEEIGDSARANIMNIDQIDAIESARIESGDLVYMVARVHHSNRDGTRSKQAFLRNPAIDKWEKMPLFNKEARTIEDFKGFCQAIKRMLPGSKPDFLK